VLDDGVMVDLSYVRDQLADFDNEAGWQVWLSPSAPPDALARLTRAGLVVDGVSSREERVTLLARQGPALALRLLVACAVAGSVPLGFAPPLLAVAAFVAAVGLALVVIAVVAGRLLMRSAVPARLREATQ